MAEACYVLNLEAEDVLRIHGFGDVRTLEHALARFEIAVREAFSEKRGNYFLWKEGLSDIDRHVLYRYLFRVESAVSVADCIEQDFGYVVRRGAEFARRLSGRVVGSGG